MRNNNHKLKREVWTRYKGKFFPLEDSQAVGWVAQDSCALSIFEGFQDLPGTTWSSPALSRGLDERSSEVPSHLNTPVTL